MTDRIAFTVLGKAEPAGSKRAFRHSKTGRVMVTDANANAKPWQAVVAAAGHEAMDGRPLFDGPLKVSFDFFQPRPKGHYGTGRNRNVLRASAPAFPTARPDLLKLARAVEDALTGVCWRDDSLIVSEALMKEYGEPAQVRVWIYTP
jgi:crossover junction endodeoxyribonuclease RusA